MLETNKDEYGDRALNTANKIVNGCIRKKTALRLKLAAVVLVAGTLFAVVLKLI